MGNFPFQNVYLVNEPNNENEKLVAAMKFEPAPLGLHTLLTYEYSLYDSGSSNCTWHTHKFTLYTHTH